MDFDILLVLEQASCLRFQRVHVVKVICRNAALLLYRFVAYACSYVFATWPQCVHNDFLLGPSAVAQTFKLIHIATPDTTRLPRLPVDRRRSDAGLAGSYA